jgi:hypothetical protein
MGRPIGTVPATPVPAIGYEVAVIVASVGP